MMKTILASLSLCLLASCKAGPIFTAAAGVAAGAIAGLDQALANGTITPEQHDKIVGGINALDGEIKAAKTVAESAKAIADSKGTVGGTELGGGIAAAIAIAMGAVRAQRGPSQKVRDQIARNDHVDEQLAAKAA